MLPVNETQTNENRADHACPAHTTAYTSPTAGSKGGRNTPQPDNTATKGNDKRQTATMDKSDIINAIHPLPAGSMERMAACMEEVAYAKGTRILRAGKTERNVFFIKKGIVRAFVSTQGREITFWLGAEGTPVVSMKSYVSGLPGYESVECIEDTVLYVLRHATLTSLFADDVNIANWDGGLPKRRCCAPKKGSLRNCLPLRPSATAHLWPTTRNCCAAFRWSTWLLTSA